MSCFSATNPPARSVMASKDPLEAATDSAWTWTAIWTFLSTDEIWVRMAWNSVKCRARLASKSFLVLDVKSSSRWGKMYMKKSHYNDVIYLFIEGIIFPKMIACFTQ